MSEIKLNKKVIDLIGEYGHVKYQHKSDIVTLEVWQDLINAIKDWHSDALCAKDARIAELERVLHESSQYLDGNKLNQIASGSKLHCMMRGVVSGMHPATPSEDGRRVLEGWGLANELKKQFPLLDDNGLCEVEHHCEWSIQQDRKRLHALLDAQPARQVGGDEREQFEAWMHTFDLPPQLEGEVFNDENYMDADCFGQFVYDEHSTQRCWAAWQARAALATAAACVMPERKSETAPPPFERGYNKALDEVDRLNRRAIPVELLESLSRSASKLINEVREFNVSGVYFTEIGDNLQHLMALEMENDELRALLGKD